MARTRRADYLRSNRARTLSLPDPLEAAAAAGRLLAAGDAAARQREGAALLAALCDQTGIAVPELVVPDDHQPHRRQGGRIVYSLQGEYRRRAPSPDDPSVGRGGRPLGRIRVPNRTPARGVLVRPAAFLHTLLHEFCHHHDAESLGLLRSFHTAGFYARLRHLRDQVDAGVQAIDDVRCEDRAEERAPARPAQGALPLFDRLWSMLRGL